jgi:hypothetical protein
MDMKKTFAETQGKENFNWFKFLNQKEISEKDWFDAELLSKDWITCACGNQCSLIPRSGYLNHPWDDELRSLGFLFNLQIRGQKKGTAMETLLKIETRSSELIYNLK